MVKAFVFIFISLLVIFVFYAVASPHKKTSSQQNHPPVVTIVSPAKGSSVLPGLPIHYSITVSDKEDGESKYDEINPKEVLLEVKYKSDALTPDESHDKTVQNDAPGLAAIRTSNCFNCHGFDTKVIGPTFTDINKRYKPTPPNMALLAKRIREGSTGVWGNVPMPTHPELTNAQIQNMVKWIMENASSADVHYYIGTQGTFSLKASSKNYQEGAYILTASYTDHGIENKGERLKGQDVIIIHTK